MKIRKSNKRPPAARLAIGLGGLIVALGALVSPSPILVMASGACLMLIVSLLWTGEDLPILLLPALFQWSEVAMVPLQTMWKQVPVNDVSLFGADLELGVFYGLAAVALLAAGMFLASKSSGRISLSERVRQEAMAWRFPQVAKVALTAIVVGYALATISTAAGPARELFNQASNVKYIGLFVLAYWCLVRRSHLRVLVAVIAFEVAFGMTGFFAEFKYSLLTVFVAALAARPRLRGSDLLVVGSTCALILTVAVFWSAVKKDYRLFANEGTGAQVVSVPLDRRLDYLAEAAAEMDAETIATGFDRLVARHGYVEFLALTMKNVPNYLPHEDGGRTLQALQHIAMPRLLFPDKPTLPHDTDVMSHYTGLPNLWTKNTSISIGYLGELYIDYGYYGGLAAAFVLGLIFGGFYRFLRDGPHRSALVNSGICLLVALPVSYFGTAYVKLIGATIMSFAIALILQRFVAPAVLPVLLRQGSRKRIALNFD